MYKSGLIDSSDAIYRHHFRGHLFVFAVHYSPLQGIALTPSPFLPLSEVFDLNTPIHIAWTGASSCVQYAMTSAFRSNGTRRCCCNPTAHCNKFYEVGRAPSSLYASHQLLVPPFGLTTVGRRTFPVAASLLCNSLPSDVQSSPSPPVFRQRLKTFPFRQCFPDIVL